MNGSAILDKARGAYSRLASYQDTGEVVSTFMTSAVAFLRRLVGVPEGGRTGSPRKRADGESGGREW